MTPVKNLLSEEKNRGESPTLKEKSSIPKNGCSKAVGGWFPPFAQGNDTTRTEPHAHPSTNQPASSSFSFIQIKLPFLPPSLPPSSSSLLHNRVLLWSFVVWGNPKWNNFFHFPTFPPPSGLPLRLTDEKFFLEFIHCV